MLRSLQRIVFALAIICLAPGCSLNYWPWGGTTDVLVPGNVGAGQQVNPSSL